MQALIEMIIGFIALLGAAALSQFGLHVDAPEKSDREIRRVHDCGDAQTNVVTVAQRRQDC